MPESVVRNAREMHTCVNSFLNSADDGLNLWKRSESILVESEVRQRRPIIRPQSPILNNLEPSASTVPILSSAWRVFITDAALITLTGIISIISCIIQSWAFFVSTQLSSQSSGSVNDPNFYSAVQTFLMQTLALYTALAPAFRSGGPRYGFWTWLLFILTLGSGIASLAIYPSFTMLSPLVAYVSNASQALVTLQLVLSTNDTQRADVKKTL